MPITLWWPTTTPSTTSERAPMKQWSSMIVGRGLQRLEHAADAGAAGEVAVLADLRARTDRRPGVDHRAGADVRADVDEARHQHHVLAEVARRGARPRPAPRARRACGSALRRSPRSAVGTLSQNGAGLALRSAAMSLVRKYSSTAFFSHSLTFQPPLPSGSATRNSPVSRPSITRSTDGRVAHSISSGVSIVRRSHALSMWNFSSSTLRPGAVCGVLVAFFLAVLRRSSVVSFETGRAAPRAAPAVACRRARGRARR